MNLLRRIGAVGVTLAALAGSAKAGIIKVIDYTSDTSVGVTSFYGKNISGADDGYGFGDQSFPPTNPPDLEAYSMVDGNKLGVDARAINTSGWDFYLGANGTVSGIDNQLKFRVTNTSDLTNKFISVYDVANPTVKWNVPQDGSILGISLPTLTRSGTTTPYAHWRMDLRDPLATNSMQISLQRSFDGGATWVSGNQSAAITYSTNPGYLDPRNANGMVLDSNDVQIGWPHGFSNTVNTQFGVYTRGAPFGGNGTNDRLTTDARPANSVQPVFVELYHNNLVDPDYSLRTAKSRLEFQVTTDDKSYFNGFKLRQDEAAYFWPDSNGTSFQNAPQFDGTLKSVLDQSGHGFLDFSNAALSNLSYLWVGDNGNGVPDNGGGDSFLYWNVGQLGAFELLPPGADFYNPDGSSPIYIEEGAYTILDTHMPEPATISLLALGAFPLLRRSRKEN